MKSMTLQRAIELDHVGQPKIHTNPFTKITTVSYRTVDYTDFGKQFVVWSDDYLMVK
mgnify:CR=1 FL=1